MGLTSQQSFRSWQEKFCWGHLPTLPPGGAKGTPTKLKEHHLRFANSAARATDRVLRSVFVTQSASGTPRDSKATFGYPAHGYPTLSRLIAA